MQTQELIASVEPRWRPDFESYITTGDASKEFIEFMLKDATLQAAVKRAFDIQADALKSLAIPPDMLSLRQRSMLVR